MKNSVFAALFAVLALSVPDPLQAQGIAEDSSRIEMMPYGNFDNWMVHTVKESFMIGGKMRETYEILKADTLRGNEPFVPAGRTPWATSSVMAHVKGIFKASTTVFPEKRGDGYCARLETRIEDVKVLGIVNLHVLATGTIYTGETLEPVKNANNPQSKISRGIPFTGQPKSLIFDYKLKVGGEQYRTSPNGMGKPKALGKDNVVEVFVYLQHRWEDKDGNLFANRVGTAYEAFSKDVDEWVNGHEIEIRYGDISKSEGFCDAIALNDKVDTKEVFYALNSEGKNVQLHEVGWSNQKPTHMIIIFTSGNGGAYVGAPGSKFWVDNVALRY